MARNKNKKAPACSSFTLIELMAVVTIIGILAGLTLGAAGAVQRHGATNRAKAEIAALQSACERFYADRQAYPFDTNAICDPSICFDPSTKDKKKYEDASKLLFSNLLGSTNITSTNLTGKRYFEPKPSMVMNGNIFVDPWGYPYGYYCNINSDGTFTPPLIWSTARQTNMAATNKWITSWPKF